MRVQATSATATAVAVALLLLLAHPTPSAGFGPVVPGACVVAHCSAQLARCGLDSVCRRWQGCIFQCGLSSASLPCQIRCADLYHPTDDTAAAIVAFSECAISTYHCVPQVGNASDCAAPKHTEQLPRFDVGAFAPGVWYVTRGLNRLFDCFDCQVHNFSVHPADPANKTLHGALKYKVREDLNCTPPACPYIDRVVRQGFAQDPAVPAHLINHNNTLAEMHYSDDWYVLAARTGAYALVYYCGCNDASCGYGGAVLYTKSPVYTLEPQDELDISNALEVQGVGFALADMCRPSNAACMPT